MDIKRKFSPNISSIKVHPKRTHIYYFVLIPIFIWIGFVCSISFMEAWLKFRAPNVSLSIGLGIGQLIFAALNKVEWTLAGLSLFLFLWSNPRPKLVESIALFLPIAILVIQTFFLLPALNERADAISQGIRPPSSAVHFCYIFVESLKVIFLFTLGVKIICNLINPRK